LKESESEKLQREPFGLCRWLMVCGGDDNGDERWTEGAVGGTARERVPRGTGTEGSRQDSLRELVACHRPMGSSSR